MDELFFYPPLNKLDKNGIYYETKIKNYEDTKKNYLIRKEKISNYPIKLILQTTEKCNLKCDMCQIPRQTFSNNQLLDMDPKFIKKVADEVFPYLIEVHPSNIGESTYSSNFPFFLDLVKKYEVLLDLTTNGILLNRKLLEKVLPVASDIKFSLDGYRKETYEKIKKNASYSVIIRNIKDAIDLIKKNNYPNKPSITIQMTLMRSNFKELPDIIKLAHELGVNKVKAFHLFSFYKKLNNEVIIGSKYEEEFNEIHEESLEIANEYNLEIEIAEPRGIDFKFQLLSIPCTLPWSQSWIDVDGAVYLCHSHNGESAGNIQKNKFIEIWNSQLYQKVRNGFRNNKLVWYCKNCGTNYYKQDFNQQVPYDICNFRSGTYNYNVPIRWSGRMKQFDLPRFKRWLL